MSNKVKSYLKVVGLVLIGVIIGASGHSQPKEKIVEKPVEHVVKQEVTPPSCARVIVIDNNIFHLMAVNFPAMNFQPITDYINSVTTERTQAVNDCASKG